MPGMAKPPSTRPLEAAAAQLRTIVMEAEEGTLIGSEDSLLAKLNVSRSTVRQVARLLEREGLLLVRRGINGGYFGTRPNARTIENTVSAYLETLHLDAEDVTIVASALWIEVLRKAAAVRTDEARAMAESYRKRVRAIKPAATFEEVRACEVDSRGAIFRIANCGYIELIFNINTAYSIRGFPPRPNTNDTPEHFEFVRAWRDAKLMELSAIFEGDVELGAMAARHIRDIWHKRVWRHHLGKHAADA
jgi:GntR family transcriptional repressor for pyruvate dehydrogenase complex